MSLFITFEGGEGSGKSTQAQALYRRLRRLSIPAVATHEPGGTRLNARLRHLLKEPHQEQLSPVAELLLFNAARAQLVTEVIKPALAEGRVVICDRFADSTTAYQGYGRLLDLNTVFRINEVGSQGLKPDFSILVDVPVEIGLGRKQATQDRFEKEDLAFHQRVRDGYLQVAGSEPGRWLVVDGTLPRKEITEIIWDKVKALLERQGLKAER